MTLGSELTRLLKGICTHDHTEDLGEGGNPIFAYARSTIFGQQMGKDGQDVFRIKGIFFAHFIPLK